MAKQAKGPAIHYRLSVEAEDHPGECHRCTSRIVTRSGLIGTVDGRPLCEKCLLQEEPRLGWALALAERIAGATGGRWPMAADGEELKTFFEFLRLAQAHGPLVPRNLRARRFLERLERKARG